MRHCRCLKRAFPVTTNSHDGPVGATGLHTYTPTVVSHAKARAERKEYSPIHGGSRRGSSLGQRMPSIESLRRIRSRSTHAGRRTSCFGPQPSWRFSGGIYFDQDDARHRQRRRRILQKTTHRATAPGSPSKWGRQAPESRGIRIGTGISISQSTVDGHIYQWTRRHANHLRSQ